tara:strand:- start:173 stop:667 length:495 start_codon:yes stop_codon:yes gene_type:complete
MNTLEITKYPSKILNQRAEGILDITPDIHSLVPQMIEAMHVNDGIGLAGPQVDISKRIIIVLEGETPHAFINPRIIKREGEQILEEEGCLSLPGLYVYVKRAEKVTVECETLDRDTVQIEASDLLARIFQHEVDHLDGKLIINRINLWERFKLREELKKLRDSK